MIALDYVDLGRIDSAVAEARLEETEIWRLQASALVYHAAGKRQEADQALTALIAKYHNTGPFQVAEVFASPGEADSAFKWLETAYRLRDGGVTQIMGDPQFRTIEHDPRFGGIFEEVEAG